jgi:hypothetical protein
MRTKLATLKELWATDKYRKALKLAAGWPRLGKHRDAIQLGWSAVSNPDFYREIGKDPDELYVAGLTSLAKRYGLISPFPNLKGSQ